MCDCLLSWHYCCPKTGLYCLDQPVAAYAAVVRAVHSALYHERGPHLYLLSVPYLSSAMDTRHCACATAGAEGASFGSPVKQAVRLAVKEALQAGKGPLLPDLLLSGLTASADSSGAGGGSSSSRSGWAAAGNSRLAAALCAAEINMRLRARVSVVTQWCRMGDTGLCAAQYTELLSLMQPPTEQQRAITMATSFLRSQLCDSVCSAVLQVGMEQQSLYRLLI